MNIIDLDTLDRKRIAVPRPLSLAWSEDNTLYALSRENDVTVLSLVDPDRLTIVRLPLDRHADRIYALTPGNLLLISGQVHDTRIGAEISWTASRYALATGATQTLSSFDKFLPLRQPDKDLLFAWLHAGVNPLDRSFLIMVHLKPPVLQAYSRISSVDPWSGALSELRGRAIEELYTSASWSPDGRRLALSKGAGSIVLLDARSGTTTALCAPACMYPSWNPRGSLLYCGGSVLASDGSAEERLLANAARSRGVWSPDGNRLVVAAQGELLLFRNFKPAFTGSDRPLDQALAAKLALLRNLLSEDLISRREYDLRRAELLQE